MKTFDLHRTINGAGDLSDGLLIAQCLKNMSVHISLPSLEIVDLFYVVIPTISMTLGYKRFEQMPQIIIA